MLTLYFVPEWFFGTSIILELLFALITFTIALFSFRIYKICKQNEHRLFANGFALISASYIVLALLNLFFLSQVDNHLLTLPIQGIVALNNLIFYSYVILFMMGLVTLAYMTLRVKFVKLYLLLNALAIIPILFSTSRLWLLYPLSGILFLYMSLHFLRAYQKNNNSKTLVIFVSFLLLFISSVGFVLGSRDAIHIFFLFGENHEMYYVVGHIIEAIAYVLLLYNLILIKKHEQKKK